MKKIATLSFFVLLSFSVFSADDSYNRAKQEDNALLFSLTGLEKLSASDFGSGLGYQYYFSNNFAFRLSIGFDYDTETIEKPEGADKDNVMTNTEFGFTPGIRYNIAGFDSNILAYIGSELLFSYNNESEEGISYQDVEASTKLYNLGIGIFIGTEWFAWKNVSLSAEYHLDYKYSFGEKEIIAGNNSQVTKKPSITNIHLGSSTANFIISFFFN